MNFLAVKTLAFFREEWEDASHRDLWPARA